MISETNINLALVEGCLAYNQYQRGRDNKTYPCRDHNELLELSSGSRHDETVEARGQRSQRLPKARQCISICTYYVESVSFVTPFLFAGFLEKKMLDYRSILAAERTRPTASSREISSAIGFCGPTGIKFT